MLGLPLGSGAQMDRPRALVVLVAGSNLGICGINLKWGRFPAVFVITGMKPIEATIVVVLGYINEMELFALFLLHQWFLVVRLLSAISPVNLSTLGKSRRWIYGCTPLRQPQLTCDPADEQLSCKNINVWAVLLGPHWRTKVWNKLGLLFRSQHSKKFKVSKRAI